MNRNTWSRTQHAYRDRGRWTRARILEQVTTNPGSTTSDISSALQLSQSAIQMQITRLHLRGSITRHKETIPGGGIQYHYYKTEAPTHA